MNALCKLIMAHPAQALVGPPPEYSHPMIPDTSSAEQHVNGPHNHLTISHDWSHDRPAGLVGGGMDGDWSLVPLEWQW